MNDWVKFVLCTCNGGYPRNGSIIKAFKSTKDAYNFEVSIVDFIELTI